MGVSFYAVLEYEQWETYWALGRLNIPRDYALFSAIAFGDGGMTEDMPYPPRGIPSNCGYEVRTSFFVSTEDVNGYLAISKLEDEEEITLEEYASGYGAWAVQEYKTSGLLPQPELYGSSWLNLNELKESLTHAGIAIDKLEPPIRAVIAAMEVLGEAYGSEKVRLVFWWGM